MLQSDTDDESIMKDQAAVQADIEARSTEQLCMPPSYVEGSIYLILASKQARSSGSDSKAADNHISTRKAGAR